MYCYNADNPATSWILCCPSRWQSCCCWRSSSPAKKSSPLCTPAIPPEKPSLHQTLRNQEQTARSVPRNICKQTWNTFRNFFFIQTSATVFFFFLSRYPTISWQCPLIRTSIHLIGKVSMMECNKDSFQLRWVLVLFRGAPSCPFVTHTLVKILLVKIKVCYSECVDLCCTQVSHLLQLLPWFCSIGHEAKLHPQTQTGRSFLPIQWEMEPGILHSFLYDNYHNYKTEQSNMFTFAPLCFTLSFNLRQIGIL